MTVLVYPDAAAVAEATAARLLLAIGDAVTTRGRAHVVLTGGTVGIATLERAAASPLAQLIDWTSVHAWWGDERWVPLGDPDRNEGQAQHALLTSLPWPEENLHRMGSPDVYASPEEAADAYARELAAFGFPVPAFDVVLLGLGPDGHVASLFPGRPELAAVGPTVAVGDSPKPPPTRVSLTFGAINAAREVWIIAAGAEKAEAVAGVIAGRREVPGALARGTVATRIIVDAAAASRA